MSEIYQPVFFDSEAQFRDFFSGKSEPDLVDAFSRQLRELFIIASLYNNYNNCLAILGSSCLKNAFMVFQSALKFSSGIGSDSASAK